MTDELPRTMRAAVLKGVRTVAIEDRSIPQLGPDDVLLEVSHCGVCGSDVHFVIDGWARPETVQGHEWSGRVIAVGDDVTEWEVGDVAVGGPSTKCGVCEHCRAGRASLCTGRDPIGESEPGDGAFAEFIVSRAPELVPIPDGVSLREAALTEPLAVALHGLTRGGVQAGQRLLVTGGGPIGALSVAAAAAGGVTDIVVSEPSPTRRALVERLGAVAVTPDALVAPRSPNRVVDDPFDVALECSGRADAMEAALGQLKRTGTLVLVGAGIVPPQFDPNRILLNELVITGACTYDDGGFTVALELLANPAFPRDLLIEPVDIELADLLPTVEQLAAGEIAGKVLVAPGRAS